MGFPCREFTRKSDVTKEKKAMSLLTLGWATYLMTIMV
ncbi:hypothetical protein D8I24_3262 (plasmid) [Cupriavidus necator H850]|nr:hypothetical protein D8I24_3262 [Cupriavidus necator H850]